jgi:hypothetical protein
VDADADADLIADADADDEGGEAEDDDEEEEEDEDEEDEEDVEDEGGEAGVEGDADGGGGTGSHAAAKTGAMGSSADSLATSKGGSAKPGGKRTSASPGDGDDDDLSAEVDGGDVEDDDEPRDEDGWSTAELGAVANAVKSAASLDPVVVFAAASKASQGGAPLSRSQDDVAQYLERVTGLIREMCPRTPSAASSDAGIRVNDMLSFLAAEVWRLVSGVERPAGEVTKLIRKEARHRAFLDKSRRKLKRDLEETRVKLEGEMEVRRRINLEAAYHQLRVGDCRPALVREAAKRRRTEAEVELYKRRDADARQRTENVKLLGGQLRGERVLDSTATADDDALMDAPAALAAVDGGGAEDSMEVDADVATAVVENGDVKEAAAGESGTSAEMDTDCPEVGRGADAGAAAVAAENAQEIRRLRALIATFESEAEGGQRACEAARTRVMALQEGKAKLEHEVYVQRTSWLPGPGANGPPPSISMAPANRDMPGRRTDAAARGAVATPGRPPASAAGHARGKAASRNPAPPAAQNGDWAESGGGAHAAGGPDGVSVVDAARPASRRKGNPVRSPLA